MPTATSWTIQTLAQALSMSPESLIKKMMLQDKKLKTPPALDSIVADDTAQKWVALQQAIAGTHSAIAAKQLPPTPTNPAPEPVLMEDPTDTEIELTRPTLKEMKTIAAQYGVTQTLVKELEAATFERSLQLTVLQEYVRAQVQKSAREGVKAALALKEVELEEVRLDTLQISLAAQQDEARLENVDQKFGLGLQESIYRIKKESDRRASDLLKRQQWLQDLSEGKPLPEEALSDPFVRYAFSTSKA